MSATEVPIHRVDTAPSTQDLVAARLQTGQDDPFAVLAAQQTAGRGRLGRRFISPAGSAFALSLGHRTDLAAAHRGWIPLITGLAVVETLRTAVDGPDGAGGWFGLKWPNDVLTTDGRKLGGILVEGRGRDALVIGIGLNLAGPIRDEGGAIVENAAWLLGPGGQLGRAADPEAVADLRDRLAARLVAVLVDELEALESAGGDGDATGALDRYTMTCLTLGRFVQIHPLGDHGAAQAEGTGVLQGTAESIDAAGRLVVAPSTGGTVAVDIGDVRHVRPADHDR